MSACKRREAGEDSHRETSCEDQLLNLDQLPNTSEGQQLLCVIHKVLEYQSVTAAAFLLPHSVSS